MKPIATPKAASAAAAVAVGSPLVSAHNAPDPRSGDAESMFATSAFHRIEQTPRGSQTRQHGTQRRVVRTRQEQRIDLAERLDDGHQIREQLRPIEPPRLDVGRQRLRSDGHQGHVRQRPLMRVRVDRTLAADDPDAPCVGRGAGHHDAGCDHIEHRERQRQPPDDRARGITREHQRRDPEALMQVERDRLDPRRQRIFRHLAIGDKARVRPIDEVKVRAHSPQPLQSRDAADAPVQDGDRAGSERPHQG